MPYPGQRNAMPFSLRCYTSLPAARLTPSSSRITIIRDPLGLSVLREIGERYCSVYFGKPTNYSI